MSTISFRSRTRLSLAALVSTPILFRQAAGVLASQAGGETYEAEGQHIVEWSDQWREKRSLVRDYEDTLDAVGLENDDDASLAMLFYDQATSTAAQMEAALALQESSSDQHEVIDQSSDDFINYALAAFERDGIAYASFMLFLQEGLGSESVAYVFESPIDVFESSMSSAQTEISVDSAGIFSGIDPAALASQAGAVASTTPEAEEETEEASTEEAEEADTPEASGSSGMSWTDEEYGFTIEWTDPWGEQDVPEGYSFSLTDGNDGQAVYLGAEGPGQSPIMLAPEMQREFAKVMPDDAEIMGSVGSNKEVIMMAKLPDQYYVRNFVMLDDSFESMAVCDIVVLADDPAEVLNSYRDSITINGHSPLENWEFILTSFGN